MKLLADVNVSQYVVARLRAAGFDAMRSTDLLDPRAADKEIIAEARRIGAVVVSHDQDFTSILAITGVTAPSLINLRVSEVDAARLAHLIATVAQVAEEDLRLGAIVTVDDGGVRIRRLPVG